MDVLVDSDSMLGGPLLVTLVETAAESAAFIATVTLSDTMGTADIVVSDGDTFSVTYVDADDGVGNTNVVIVSSATIDCAPPAIQTVSVSNIEARSATVNVDFDEASSLTVNYGTSMFALNDSASVGSYSTSQSVNISGLTDQTTYFFTIDATDQAGNVSSDDNGGAGYTFTTPDIPDFFTELFGSGLDLEGMSLTLTPDGGPDWYKATIEPLAGGLLPFEPTDGSFVSLSDDDSQQINVSGGDTVKIYGESFTSFNIGSNGYVTFGSSSTDYSESLEEHIAVTRVSILYDDLNPSVSGSVYQQQLSDRVVISYDRVTEYNGGNQNTLQIELHFDGTIVMSWEKIDSGDALVGISDGTGQDPDFIMSDLSSFPEPNTCLADINGDGLLNFFDVSLFITAFGASDPLADFNQDGIFNFFDISDFVNQFSAGCP